MPSTPPAPRHFLASNASRPPTHTHAHNTNDYINTQTLHLKPPCVGTLTHHPRVPLASCRASRRLRGVYICARGCYRTQGSNKARCLSRLPQSTPAQLLPTASSDQRLDLASNWCVGSSWAKPYKPIYIARQHCSVGGKLQLLCRAQPDSPTGEHVAKQQTGPNQDSTAETGQDAQQQQRPAGSSNGIAWSPGTTQQLSRSCLRPSPHGTVSAVCLHHTTSLHLLMQAHHTTTMTAPLEQPRGQSTTAAAGVTLQFLCRALLGQQNTAMQVDQDLPSNTKKQGNRGQPVMQACTATARLARL